MKNNQKNTEFYEDLWKNQWADMEKYNPTAQHLKNIIKKKIANLKNIKTFADIGCGAGYNIQSLKKVLANIDITGTDLTSEITQIAERNIGDKKIRFTTLDLEKNFLKEKFDLILCNQVLEHIENDLKAIENLRKMCNKYILITVPAGEFNSTSKINGHFRHYSIFELREKIEKNNFKILEIYEWGFPFHTLYKKILNFLPASAQKKIGFGKYGIFKKLISKLIFLSFYLNFLKKGENIILLAETN